jgi:glycosyltransferase involved in cell wall biosynthesis
MTHRPLSPPSVLIDASALSSVASGSGIGTYVRNLLASLAAEPHQDLTVNALATVGAPLPLGIGRRPIRRRVTERARGEVIEHAVMLPIDVLRRRAPGEVFHNPGFHAPCGIRGPWVQTLLDVIPLVVDDPDVRHLRKRWKRFGPRYLKADAIIAISRHAADEGIRLLGLDPDRVFVAHLGVNPMFAPGPDGPADPPYLLVVSEYSRRKGFDRAFAAIAALADAGYPHTLKVVGRVHDWGREELRTLHAGSGRPERVEILGFVPDLAALYRGATAVLMTSRYEGFGLPAVEAMASGVPVVAFANTAVAEIVDGAGQLVPDGDVPAMVQAIRSVLDSSDEAFEWRQRGLARAAEMTWAKSAAIHAEVYRLVAQAAG